jgi:hypothetical protein
VFFAWIGADERQEVKPPPLIDAQIRTLRGRDGKAMTIKRRACGYRNREHVKTAIYFFCGGLDLYPKQA